VFWLGSRSSLRRLNRRSNFRRHRFAGYDLDQLVVPYASRNLTEVLRVRLFARGVRFAPITSAIASFQIFAAATS
jgi:hypothetical protein